MTGRILPLLLAVLLIGGCTLVRVDLGPQSAPLEEKTIAGEGQAKILLVEISGVMLTGRSRPALPWQISENIIARLAEELDTARRDPEVKGLIVKIDSPGGAVAVADLLYHQLDAFKREKKIPVSAQLMSVAASGGYYAALAADEIAALPATVTGSVGVISVKLNLQGLMNRYGVETETVKSGLYKDMWSPFRGATPEERRVMQSLIDRFFARFIGLVKENRPGLTAAQTETVASARIFSAEEALETGLIDRIAYPEETFDRMKETIGVKEARLVVYHRPGAYRPNVYARSDAAPDALTPEDLIAFTSAPQLMYLWLPGLP